MEAVLAGMSVLLVVAAVTYLSLSDRLATEARLQSLTAGRGEVKVRAARPAPRFDDVIKRLRGAIVAIAPQGLVDSASVLLERAGALSRIDGATFVFRQVLAVILTLSVWIVIALVVGLPSWASLVAVGVVLAIVVIPYVNLADHASRRQREMQAGFPDFLDLLVVCVEAGLAVDAALQRVTRESRGVIRDEFSRAIAEIQVTRSRGQALANVARRTGVDDVARFAMAIRQAEQVGIGIAAVLRAQAALERDFAFRRAEERAARIPVKMIVPVVLFILPAMFIIILGPALINMMAVFSR